MARVTCRRERGAHQARIDAWWASCSELNLGTVRRELEPEGKGRLRTSGREDTGFRGRATTGSDSLEQIGTTGNRLQNRSTAPVNTRLATGAEPTQLGMSEPPLQP